jgi:hypothetical protein
MRVYSEFMHTETGPAALGREIKRVYSPLFEHSKEPHKDRHDQLRNLFNIHSGGSGQTINYQIQTFKALADHAKFDGALPASGEPPKPGHSDEQLDRTQQQVQREMIPRIDLHIHLPEHKTQRDYTAIIEDIARHILGRKIDEPVD